MRAAFFTPVFALAVYAQSQSSSIDDFPQTSFLTQTNSLGVVTGQPAVNTNVGNPDSSIPAQAPVETSQPPVASIPAVAPGINTIQVPGTGNTTRTLVVSANNSTTVVLGNPTPSGSPTGTEARTTGADASGSGASGASGATGSRTGASGSQSTGAAPTMGAMAGSIFGVGALVAAFL